MFRGWWWAPKVALPYFLLLGGFMSLLVFGIAGPLRGALPFQLDLQTLYGSGWKLARGIVPYGPPDTPADLAAQGVEVWLYAYPPSFAPLAMGLAALGWPAAKVVAVALNLAAAVVVAVLVGLMMAPRRSGAWRPEQIAVTGIILASPFAAHVLWLGNTTLIVVAALLLAWKANDEGRQIEAGLLLSLVAIKPQLALLPGIWLLMERRWRLIAAAAAGSFALSAYAMTVYGPLTTFAQWISGVWTYLASGENAPGCLYCFGIGDTLAAGNLRIYNIEVMAFLSSLLLWRLRDRLSRLDILACLMALTAFFLPVHNYDLVILAPVAGAIGVRAAGSTRTAAAALLAAASFFIPLRIVQLAGSPLLLRWRELILVVLISLIVASALRRTSPIVPAKDAAAPLP